MFNTDFAPIAHSRAYGGDLYRFRFDNGLGASVMSHVLSYGGEQGLWEIAVIKFDGDGWDLYYDTPITDNVIGYLEKDEVGEILERINALVWEK